MWENVCNLYIIPTPLLYNTPTLRTCYFIFSISSLSQAISRLVYTRFGNILNRMTNYVFDSIFIYLIFFCQS